MTYTEGIRKIFNADVTVIHFSKACELAEKAGYDALCYNGVVYTCNSGIWLYTCFKITDFMVGTI